MKHIHPPVTRYNIYTGTNSFIEWRYVARRLLLNQLEESPDSVHDYEKKFAEYCGGKHAIAFGAGRMALYAILSALNIGAGDEVIVPAFTCVVVVNAILYCGARPVYADIDLKTFNVALDSVQANITSKTKAIYAQHTFGVVCNIAELRAMGVKLSVPVIEDAAHALGATYFSQRVGVLSEVSFFSTDHSKMINTHLGGIAVTNNDDLAEKLKTIQQRSFILDKSAVRRMMINFLLEYVCFSPSVLWIGDFVYKILSRAGLTFFFHDELETCKPSNYPCRYPSILAEIGISQLENYPENLAHRKRLAHFLEKKIHWYGFSSEEMDASAWLRYSFLINDRCAFEKRFAKHFDLGVWFTSVLGGRKVGLEQVGYTSGSCPAAEFAAQHIVNFPTHPRVNIRLLENMIDRHQSWLEDNILYV